MNIKTRRAPLALSIALAIGAGGVNSFSQAAVLEEVIVNATKRATSTQDIPISINAVSEEALKSGAVADVRSLTSVDPSFTVTTSQSSSTATSLKVRGIGTVGNNAGFEGAVGVFIDGVYQPRAGVPLSEFVDVEAVEMLRGPQGTLFGKNTSAGALSIRTKAPQIGVTEGFVSATVGNYSLVNLKGAYNIDVSDTFAVRIAGSNRTRDGVYTPTHPFDFDDANDRDRYVARVSSLWEPNDTVSLRVTADLSENDELCCALVGIETGGDPDVETIAGFPVGGPDPGAFEFGHEVFEDASEQVGLTAELNVDFGENTFTYVGGYRDFESTAVSDGDFSGAVDTFNPIDGQPFSQAIEVTSHEFRLQGLAFDERLDWLVGAYYADETIESGFGLQHGSFIDTAFAGLVGAATFLGFGAEVTANGLDTLGPVEGNFSFSDFGQDGETKAIFTHNILDITDAVSFTLGLRYVEEEKSGGLFETNGVSNCLDYDAAADGFATDLAGNAAAADLVAGVSGLTAFNCNALTAPADLNPGLSLYQDSFKDDALTWTTSLSFRATDDITTYVTVSEGFKSGGLNLDPSGSGGLPGNGTFDSETIRNYELGIKSQLMDGRVRLNAAVYRMDIEGYQLQAFAGVGFVVFNIDNSESQGAEIDLTAALSDYVTMDLSVAYAEPEFEETCVNGDLTNVPALITSQCGQNFLDASLMSATLGVSVNLPVGNDMELVFNPSAVYESERRSNPNVTRLADAATFVNMSASLSGLDTPWSLQLWGTNLTNEVQEGRALSSTAVTIGAPGVPGYEVAFLSAEPRTYGLTARYEF